MNFVYHFLQSNWIKKAAVYAYNPKRLKALVLQLGFYLSRKGASRLRKQIQLLYCYLRDVATGKYKDYNISSLIFIIASVLYLLCPIDFIPDPLPSGLIDDTAIILWAMNASSKELERYNENKESNESE